MWRKTPQTTLVRSLIAEMGHATNQELLLAAHKTMPNMTATTVHRITTRLVNAGMASYAPMNDGIKVIDNNTSPHDHFVCHECGKIRDIDVADAFLPSISKELGDCEVIGRLVISGNCDRCLAQKSKKEATT